MENKRENILLKAREIIAKKGYYNATIKEIAKKAGVAQGTPYLYFKNKEEIFIELILSFQVEIDTIISEALKIDLGFWSRIEYIVFNVAKYLSSNKEIMTILRREMPEPLGIGKKGKDRIKEIIMCREDKMQKVYNFKLLKGGTEFNKNFTDDEVERLCRLMMFGLIKGIEQGEENDYLDAANFIIKCLKSALSYK